MESGDYIGSLSLKVSEPGFHVRKVWLFPTIGDAEESSSVCVVFVGVGE